MSAKYAIIELVSKNLVTKMGIDYPTSKVITGLFSGIVKKDKHVFIVLTDKSGSVIAYNTEMYSILCVEVSHGDFRFKQEVGKIDGVKYIFPNNSEEDQSETILECEKIAEAFKTFPGDVLFPGIIDSKKFLETPNWWKEQLVAGLPEKSITANPVIYNNFNRRYPNTTRSSSTFEFSPPAKKSVLVFKRKGKLPTKDSLEAMRNAVKAVETANVKQSNESTGSEKVESMINHLKEFSSGDFLDLDDVNPVGNA